ncbi:head-tail connector protein [Ligilactobacillus saerimneri]
MSYLSYDEYKSLGFNLEEQQFDKYLKRAESQIDSATRAFYRSVDIGTDQVEDRVAAFKTAICEQVDFLAYAGSETSYQLAQNDYNSVSIGRLSLSPKSGLADTVVGGVCMEARDLLGRYGLLFTGV